MAIRSSFFNSVNGDRRYLAYNFAEYFASFIGNGVFANPSNTFQVYEKENMIVNVKAGKAWINGYIAVNDGDYNLTITNADGVLNRIDRIVLRLDFNVRAINIAVKKGAFASTPVAPTLQRDAEVYELVLADVYVGKGITKITQSNITDQRMNKALCGVVKGTVDQIDTTDLFNQYGSAFQEWFETVKNYLNDTAVGNVANKLAEHTLEGNAHGIGDKKTLLTAQKTTLVDSINELADYVRTPGYGVVTGTNAYAVTLNPAPTSYKDGMGLVIKINTASTGATTINVNALGAKPILKANGAPVSDLKAGAVYSIRYNGMAFILQGEGGDEREIVQKTISQIKKTYFITFIDNTFLYAVDNDGTKAYKILRSTMTLLATLTVPEQSSSTVIVSYSPSGIIKHYDASSYQHSYLYSEAGILLAQRNYTKWLAYDGKYFYQLNTTNTKTTLSRTDTDSTTINTFLTLLYTNITSYARVCIKENSNVTFMFAENNRSQIFCLEDNLDVTSTIAKNVGYVGIAAYSIPHNVLALSN